MMQTSNYTAPEIDHSDAIVISQPFSVSMQKLKLQPPAADDVLVDVLWSSVSSGTEKLLYKGEMPAFPGMEYPLVPGYEAVGRVSWAGPKAQHRVGDQVFVPGANCFEGARGLFGASASHLLTADSRVVSVHEQLGEKAVLIALAATAQHAISVCQALGSLPELIVGHGIVGRLLARLCLAHGGSAPTVWENNPQRIGSVSDYCVVSADDDLRRDYRMVIDASGDSAIVDALVPRLSRRGKIVLAGFYSAPVQFSFPPAFQREASISIAAEWQPEDLIRTADMVANGELSLDGLITHQAPVTQAVSAYPRALEDPDCLKMVIDWRCDDSRPTPAAW
jgi:bacteriochlorophyllide a dehydrogenase